MIIVSARKSFSDSDKLSKSGHLIKEIDLKTDKEIRSIDSVEQLKDDLLGKKVLILVHGFNSEQEEVHDAYSVIESNVNENISDEYDYIIGYSWPGGDKGFEWWPAKRRANSVARRFRMLLEELSDSTITLDAMSHSLGARVVLKALKQSDEDQLIRNYYCTAPAVDNEVLEKGEEFADSVAKVESLYVFHSKKDGVLSVPYSIAEFDRALGLYGPEDKQYIQNKTKNIYIANCKKHVESHGGYKRCKPLYKYILSAYTKKPVKFKTL